MSVSPETNSNVPSTLNPFNPRHYLLLAYYIFFQPTALNTYLYNANPELRQTAGGDNLLATWRIPAYRNLYLMAPGMLILSSLLIALPLSLIPSWAQGTSIEWLEWVIGLIEGVALGLVFGVAFAVAKSVASGVSLGTSISITFSIAFGVAEGVVFGVAGGIVFGLVLGIVFSVAFGLMLYALLGARKSIIWNTIIGLVTAASFGFAEGVIEHAAFGIACGVGYLIGVLFLYFSVDRSRL